MNAKNKSATEQAEALFEQPAPTTKAVHPTAKVGSDYRSLLAQREALEEKIAEARASEVEGVLEQIRQLVADYGLENEVTFTQAHAQRGRGGPRGPAAPKYRDPETGNTWSGRGKPPSWIKGQDRDQFLIA